MAHPVTAVDLASNVRPGGTTQASNPHSVAGFRGEVATELEAVATHYPVVAQVAEPGTARTAPTGDFGKDVVFSAATATAYTIQAEAAAAAQPGTRIGVIVTGAGSVTPTPAAGVTILAAAAVLQNNRRVLTYLGSDTWLQSA